MGPVGQTKSAQVQTFRPYDVLGMLLAQLSVAAIAYPNLLRDTEMGKGHRLGRTLLIKDLSTVPTMVLAVRERERSTASQADVRVNPFWCGLCIHHCRADRCRVSWWEAEACAVVR